MSDSIRGFSFGDLRFDWLRVLKDTTKLPLTDMERRILEYLVIRRPAEVSAHVIAAHLYGRVPSQYDIRSFWSALYTLRIKLRAAQTTVVIQTHCAGGKKRNYSAGLMSQVAE